MFCFGHLSIYKKNSCSQCTYSTLVWYVNIFTFENYIHSNSNRISQRLLWYKFGKFMQILQNV